MDQRKQVCDGQATKVGNAAIYVRVSTASKSKQGDALNFVQTSKSRSNLFGTWYCSAVGNSSNSTRTERAALKRSARASMLLWPTRDVAYST